jgi:tetratricopeptide (TPR) repeat protein
LRTLRYLREPRGFLKVPSRARLGTAAQSEHLIALGDSARRDRRSAAAKRELDRALELDATSVSAYGGLALLSRTLGDFEQSNDYAQRALQLDDDFYYCQRLIAWNLFDLGRSDEAIERLRQVAAEAPRAEEVRADLALALSAKGDSPAPIRQ